MNHTLRNLLGFALVVLLFSCQKEVSMEGGPVGHAVLQDSFGECMPKNLVGSYRVGQTLTDSNYLEVQVNVITAGHYSVGTGQQNGISFYASGNFTQPGLTTIHLRGIGTPIAEGPVQFALSYDSSACDFIVNILPATPGGGNGGCNATVNGTYKKNTSLSVGNNIGVQHTFAAAGAYNVHTDTVNGYYFTVSVNAPAGSNQAITMYGAGMPSAAQTDHFIIHFGDNDTCGFNITVQDTTSNPPPPGSTYFPLTGNSWWSYINPTGSGSTDTLLMTNTGSVNENSQTYMRFITKNSSNTPIDTGDYRRDNSTGIFYRYINLQRLGSGIGITFTQTDAEYPFLKEVMQTGDTLMSAMWTGTNSFGQPAYIRLVAICDNGNSTATYNGNTFTNVYEVTVNIRTYSGSSWAGLGNVNTRLYAPGVGIINKENNNTDIRYWHIY